jgi:UDP-glucose:(heptosyl)LPS alpha-1,3-glucosyltransferase
MERHRTAGDVVKIAIGILKLSPRGGLEDHALRISAELARRGHEVALHTTGKLPETGVAAVSLDRGPSTFTNHGRVNTFARAFQRVTAGRFDRIVGFHPMPGLDVLFLADHLRNRQDVPVVKRLLPRFRTYARLEASCFDGSSKTRVLGLALPQMRAFAERYPESRSRIVVLPPTITDARRKPHLRTADRRRQMAARLGIEGSPQTWLWLGLQPHIKGLDRVVEALAMVPDATLLVGGIKLGDSKLASVNRRIARLGIAKRIRWLGFMSDDDVPAAFATADVLAHPARVDVTGGVILEALTNGLPVVATDCCGFSTHVALSGGGRVISSSFGRDEFVRALAEVCGPQNAAMSQQGISYGESPALFSGLSAACDLIEADSWPREMTLAGGAAPLEVVAS